MNINLNANYPRDEAGLPSTFAGEVDNHIISMATAGYAVTGEHVLVPEGRDYPGAYQVWLHVNGNTYIGWIHVNTAGEIQYREHPGQKEGVYPT